MQTGLPSFGPNRSFCTCLHHSCDLYPSSVKLFFYAFQLLTTQLGFLQLTQYKMLRFQYATNGDLQLTHNLKLSITFPYMPLQQNATLGHPNYVDQLCAHLYEKCPTLSLQLMELFLKRASLRVCHSEHYFTMTINLFSIHNSNVAHFYLADAYSTGNSDGCTTCSERCNQLCRSRDR